MTTPHTRSLRAPTFALLGLLTLGACQDAGDPVAVSVDDQVLSEAAMDVAADQVEQQYDEMTVTAQDERQRDRTRPEVDRVGLAVAMSGTAVDLAAEILAREGADDRQRALFDQAEEFHRQAVGALARGDHGLAVRMAQQAFWTALKAWIAPGGVTRDEATAVQTLARQLLDDATSVVGDDDRLRGLILSWAQRFYQQGAAALAAGHLRGVMPLWKAAVLSAHLLR